MFNSYEKEIKVIEDDSAGGLEIKCNDLIKEMKKKYRFVDLLDSKVTYNEKSNSYIMVLTFDVSTNMTM